VAGLIRTLVNVLLAVLTLESWLALAIEGRHLVDAGSIVHTLSVQALVDVRAAIIALESSLAGAGVLIRRSLAEASILAVSLEAQDAALLWARCVQSELGL